MTAPRPGDPFDLDLGGTVISGQYIEVDSPHRLLIGWDRQGTDHVMPTRALIEITLTSTADGTTVKVQFSGLSAEDTAIYRQLWARHLDQIAVALVGAEPAQSSRRGLSGRDGRTPLPVQDPGRTDRPS